MGHCPTLPLPPLPHLRRALAHPTPAPPAVHANILTRVWLLRGGGGGKIDYRGCDRGVDVQALPMDHQGHERPPSPRRSTRSMFAANRAARASHSPPAGLTAVSTPFPSFVCQHMFWLRVAYITPVLVNKY
jgi:hypothetical protein